MRNSDSRRDTEGGGETTMNQKNATKARKKESRSQVALAAILRSGAGAHTDRRAKRQTRSSWRREVW